MSTRKQDWLMLLAVAAIAMGTAVAVILSAPSPAAVEVVQTRYTQAAAPVAVNVNTATVEELTALPGIGEVTATHIVEHREQVGPFAKPEDLLDVKGIGEAKLEEIRPYITLN